jgi:hypothetical protein
MEIVGHPQDHAARVKPDRGLGEDLRDEHDLGNGSRLSCDRACPTLPPTYSATAGTRGRRAKWIAARLRREFCNRRALPRQENEEAPWGFGLEAKELLTERARLGELVSGMLKLESRARQGYVPGKRGPELAPRAWCHPFARRRSVVVHLVNDDFLRSVVVQLDDHAGRPA